MLLLYYVSRIHFSPLFSIISFVVNMMYLQIIYHTVGNFMGLIFHGLGSLDDFVGLYFHGVPPLII